MNKKSKRVSEQFNSLKDAESFYERLPHGTLIRSDHWASEGYWVENPAGKLSKWDTVIKQK